MISRLEGELASVTPGAVEICCGRVWYQLLVPAHDEQRLSTMLGTSVQFYTLHYLEGLNQGASYVPRLIGFASAEDRAFFQLFTTVKGLGNRKALRALQLPFPTVAQAIAEGDVDVLTSLPEIGKRTAQTIVTELREKIDGFVELKPGAEGGAVPDAVAGLMQDAVTVLVQLGESRVQARRLVDRVVRADPTLDSADAVVAAAFRLKEL